MEDKRDRRAFEREARGSRSTPDRQVMPGAGNVLPGLAEVAIARAAVIIAVLMFHPVRAAAELRKNLNRRFFAHLKRPLDFGGAAVFRQHVNILASAAEAEAAVDDFPAGAADAIHKDIEGSEADAIEG